jgi:lipopolysaccharide export system protein LptA
LPIATLAALPPAAAQTLSVPRKTARCETVELAAEEGTCDYERCVLSGDVQLRCEEIALWADVVEVELGPDQTFAGARAEGHVIVVEGASVTTCSRITLGPDRIQGRVDAATVQVKRNPRQRGESGVPTGRDRAVFQGDIERLGEGRLSIDDAGFTLCDCGDEPPSWRIDASHVDADVSERAVLWWPQLKINPFGLGLVPITPPLLPLSVPLEGRAPGFLAPRLLFLNFPWPLVDLPFFIPLGRSWDLTVVPGIRTDWGRHRVTPVSTWGAPRLGGRLRYAPTRSTSGELNIEWTWDRKLQAARAYLDQVDGVSTAEEIEALPDTSGAKRTWLARRRLEHRVAVNFTHRTDFAENLRWLADVDWISDDLVTNDFRLTLDERVPGYMPSRTALEWRRPGAAASLAADYLLRIQTSVVDDYSNVRGAERATAHRGPAVRLRILPTAVGDGVYVDADLNAVRYGPWATGLAATRSLGGLAAGIAYRDRLGPVALGVRTGVDGLWVDPAQRDDLVSVVGRVDADASVRLAARAGGFAHVVQPGLIYRGLPFERDAPPADPAVDERLERRSLHQAAMVLNQSLLHLTGAAPAEAIRLAVEQPFDLEAGEPLQTRANLRATLPGVGSAGLLVGIDATRENAVQEIGTEISARIGPLSGRAKYTRLLPYADRLRRTVYELGATAAPADPNAWVHFAGGTVTLQLGSQVRATYQTDYVFRAPADLPQGNRDSGFVQHVVTAGYASPCDCWQIDLRVVVPGENPLENPLQDWSAAVTLAVAGYSVGN